MEVTKAHYGKSNTQRVVFHGDNDGTTKLLGGQTLDFVKGEFRESFSFFFLVLFVLQIHSITLKPYIHTVSSLSNKHPARKLANLANLWAAPPPPSFPSSNAILQWPDDNCRDYEGYASPPTLSFNGNSVLTRAREPNLPSLTFGTGEQSMDETHDNWLRTTKKSTSGIAHYKSSDSTSINKASNTRWNSGSVVVHMFPLIDW